MSFLSPNMALNSTSIKIFTNRGDHNKSFQSFIHHTYHQFPCQSLIILVAQLLMRILIMILLPLFMLPFIYHFPQRASLVFVHLKLFFQLFLCQHLLSVFLDLFKQHPILLSNLFLFIFLDDILISLHL